MEVGGFEWNCHQLEGIRMKLLATFLQHAIKGTQKLKLVKSEEVSVEFTNYFKASEVLSKL